jgi:uncharacterized protein
MTAPKVLVFSDIHGDVRALERLIATEADYYVAAGDLVTFARGLDRVGEVLQRHGDRVLVIPGNHESAADIARFCATYGLRDVHSQAFTLGAVSVAALGYSCPTPFDTPGEYSEAELAARLQTLGEARPQVLFCHCPPKNTPLDRIRDGLHAGSTAIADFLAAQQPQYFFCGHIHEAEGADVRLGRTRAINVGKRGFLLDFATLSI